MNTNNIVDVGGDKPTEEKREGTIIMIERGESGVKNTLKDYVKFGFGFYVGYNLARALKKAILKLHD